jgi:hypothetical protein
MASQRQRVRAHCAGDAAASGFGCDHVAAIGDVVAAAALIGAQIIRTDDGPGILGGENAVPR